MTVKRAVTFGQKYNREPHPRLPGLTAQMYLVVEGEDWEDCRRQMFDLTDGAFAFEYDLDEFLAEQVPKWGYVEYEAPKENP